jgi:hypothetical protein
MYILINRFAEAVVGFIPHNHVADYEWLLQNTAQVTTPDYQKKYRLYWAMNVAQMSPLFYAAYFRTLDIAMKQTVTLREVAQILYDASARRDGRQSLQFSFATKLLHMTNPSLPIFDSQIAGFYFFQEAATGLNLQQRIDGFAAFHDFLVNKYARVLKCGLLAEAIQEYRCQLKPQHVTDEKIVDSLIWAFVGLLRKGALPKNQVTYS